MDQVKNFLGNSGGQQQQQGGQQQQAGGEQQGGFNLGSTISGITSGKTDLNSMAGGGEQGERNEDYLDKGVDMFQQHVMQQGPQDNESAAEQAKDEVMSDMIRDKYKGMTGSDFPIKDKDQKFGM